MRFRVFRDRELEMSGAWLNFVAALLYIFGPFVKIVLSSAVFLVRGGLKNIIFFTEYVSVFQLFCFFPNKLRIAIGATSL